MTARTPRTLCHLLTIMFPRQRGGLQLSQATQTAASAAAMSGLPVDSCWHFCKVAGCQQTKCVNLAFGCSTGLRFTAVPTTGLWYCWRAWSGCVTGPPHVYMRCTLWVALKAFWWSELVPSQTPHRKKKKNSQPPHLLWSQEVPAQSHNAFLHICSQTASSGGASRPYKHCYIPCSDCC